MYGGQLIMVWVLKDIIKKITLYSLSYIRIMSWPAATSTVAVLVH